MYKTFELFQRSIAIVLFWSIILYILEVRKSGRGFIEVATETAIGWGIFLLILILFITYISSSYRKTKDERKEKITKNVVEDGMAFTVGGHSKFINVLPENHQIESETINEYELKFNSDLNLKKETTKERSDVLKKILTQDLSIDFLSESNILSNKEGKAKDDHQRINSFSSHYGDKFQGQSNGEIEAEANKGFQAIKGQYDDSHESRRIDKGLFAYKHQFNLLLSQILYNELHQLNRNPPKGEKALSKKELKELKAQLTDTAIQKKTAIEETLKQVLDAVESFEYGGITTTTPRIKNRRDLDLSSYQLVIFSALFPYISWFDLRSSLALNDLDPDLRQTLSSDEISKIKSSELGLSLRDKRILWNARRMYDIYQHRDIDLAKHGKSNYNMPISFDAKGKMYNPLEETVALCELFRFSQTKRLVIKEQPQPKKKAPYDENDIIRLVYSLFDEKDRFNTTGIDQIGCVKSNTIYLDIDKFVPKFNGRFKEKYPNHANQVEYKRALNMLYEKLKKMGLLAMRILDEDSESSVAETYSHRTDGELFTVEWEYKNDSDTKENMLLIHGSQMFRDIVSKYQIYPSVPRIRGISEGYAIPETPHYHKIKPLIDEAIKLRRKVKEYRESVKESQKSLPPTKVEDVEDKLNKALKAETTGAAQDTTPPVNAEATTATAQGQNTGSVKNGKVAETPDETTDTPPTIVTPNPLDGLDFADSALVDQIASLSYSAVANDLERGNVTLDKQEEDIKSPYEYLNQRVQVISFKKKGNRESSESLKCYAVNDFSGGKIQRIENSRKSVNLAAENLDFTILKLLNAKMENKLKDDVFTHTSKSQNLQIPKQKIYLLFNVIEQMALYQVKGSSEFWRIKSDDYKVDENSKSKGYTQISVIECINIEKSQEEQLYKKFRENMWQPNEIKNLFNEIEERLNKLSKDDLRKYEIQKNPEDGSWLMPKQHLGKLRSTGVGMNNFLTYCNQYHGKLREDVRPYADNLKALVFGGSTYILFVNKK